MLSKNSVNSVSSTHCATLEIWQQNWQNDPFEKIKKCIFWGKLLVRVQFEYKIDFKTINSYYPENLGFFLGLVSLGPISDIGSIMGLWLVTVSLAQIGETKYQQLIASTRWGGSSRKMDFSQNHSIWFDGFSQIPHWFLERSLDSYNDHWVFAADLMSSANHSFFLRWTMGRISLSL